MSETCPRCGQPLPPQKRLGVYMPPKKAAIFDFVRDHPTVTAEGIRAQCFNDNTTLKTIRVHICQINDLLAGTEVMIKGDIINGKREHGGYRIVKRAAKKWKPKR
jgi:hypothetical protein